MASIHRAEGAIRLALALNPQALQTAEQLLPPTGATGEEAQPAEQSAEPRQPLRRLMNLSYISVPQTLESGLAAANKSRYTPVGSLLR